MARIQRLASGSTNSAVDIKTEQRPKLKYKNMENKENAHVTFTVTIIYQSPPPLRKCTLYVDKYTSYAMDHEHQVTECKGAFSAFKFGEPNYYLSQHGSSDGATVNLMIMQTCGWQGSSSSQHFMRFQKTQKCWLKYRFVFVYFQAFIAWHIW